MVCISWTRRELEKVCERLQLHNSLPCSYFLCFPLSFLTCLLLNTGNGQFYTFFNVRQVVRMLDADDEAAFDCMESTISNKVIEVKVKCMTVVERQYTLIKMRIPVVQLSNAISA